jgi:hypothetical protein
MEKTTSIPKQEQIDIANAEKLKRKIKSNWKAAAVNDIYVGPTTLEDTPEGIKTHWLWCKNIPLDKWNKSKIW